MKYLFNLLFFLRYYYNCKNYIIIKNKTNNTKLKSFFLYDKSIEIKNVFVIDENEKCNNIKENNIYIFTLKNYNLTNYCNIIKKYKKQILNKNSIFLIINQVYLEIFLKLPNKYYFDNKPYILDKKLFLLNCNLEIKQKNDLAYFLPILNFLICYFIFKTLFLLILKRFSFFDPNLDDFIIINSIKLKYDQIKKEQNCDTHCIICYSDYENTSKIRKLSCNHYFHAECIDKWLISRQHFCPCCRLSIKIINK